MRSAGASVARTFSYGYKLKYLPTEEGLQVDLFDEDSNPTTIAITIDKSKLKEGTEEYKKAEEHLGLINEILEKKRATGLRRSTEETEEIKTQVKDLVKKIIQNDFEAKKKQAITKYLGQEYVV